MDGAARAAPARATLHLRAPLTHARASAHALCQLWMQPQRAARPRRHLHQAAPSAAALVAWQAGLCGTQDATFAAAFLLPRSLRTRHPPSHRHAPLPRLRPATFTRWRGPTPDTCTPGAAASGDSSVRRMHKALQAPWAIHLASQHTARSTQHAARSTHTQHTARSTPCPRIRSAPSALASPHSRPCPLRLTACLADRPRTWAQGGRRACAA